MSWEHDINLRMVISLSKVMAFLLFVGSLFIDITQKTGGENLRFNTPWIAGILGVKQYMDGKLKQKING